MKIGFFDSGLGGLTILRKVITNIEADFYYLADNKNTPYGVKEKELVKKYIFENIEKLINIGCKIIVIACNTATSIAIEDLRKKYQDIIFIGTEPPVKVVHDSKDSKKAFVFSTTITSRAERLKNLIQKLNMEDKVTLIPLDKLVEFAESGHTCKSNAASEYIQSCINEYNLDEYSHIVLGCTHFAIFYNEFRNIFGDNIKILDSSAGIERNLKAKIKLLDDDSTNFSLNILLSKESDIFLENATNILNIKDLKYTIV